LTYRVILSEAQRMNEQWYCIRCIFDLGPSADAHGFTSYEERLVLIQAQSFEQAIRKAEKDAKEYAGQRHTYTGCAQAYKLFAEHIENGFGSGTEVFSLIRDSELSREDYIDAFFDTGHEKQGDYLQNRRT
jgi:hypothetical protein